MKHRKKVYIIFFVVIFCTTMLVILGRYALYGGYIRLNYPSLTEYPVQGIDISHHQQYVDWDRIDKAKVTFAFMKATEGAAHVDSLFDYNLNNARRLGIAQGAYHYFSFCKTGEEQAENFLSVVRQSGSEIIPIIDLEYSGNCMEENRVDDIMYEAETFIRIVELELKTRVLVYTTNEFYENNLLNKLPDNPIWIRDIIKKPKLSDGRAWLFWQYTNRGKLDGIRAFVDLNAFYGSKSEFDDWMSNLRME